ncbi:hypothetical protein ACOJ84_003922 [Morganella morganii]|uniref:hypothetical protein n=1 Tax=Morganella morganii TaxID=582 RepID=UPI001115D51A|nr:hypothetical protein [Morganella morganii]EJG2203117.1 hypothetical protein [Morganella morganii]ELJ5776663.1 hypothetical protein [Morganella morganii]ELN8407548.1 hypothetical protein [Morganella morganii]MBX9344984.1 hypothetical protein [Morganella morganii]MBX9370306.1 hypothetical protein [Morganella morganii]
MSYLPIDLVNTSRKIDALQSAISIALTSLAMLTPIVKSEVINNLENFAKNSKDPTVKKAFSELADKIKSSNMTIK